MTAADQVEPDPMWAITVQQPWAWAIIHGPKRIENRTRIGTWRKLVGETIAVHTSGSKWSVRGQTSGLVWDALAAVGWPTGPKSAAERGWMPRGVVIGVVDVTDVHMEEGGCCAPWGEESYTDADGKNRTEIVHIVTANPRRCDPIDLRGMLGPWKLPADVADELRRL